jgi:hypothetical protein
VLSELRKYHVALWKIAGFEPAGTCTLEPEGWINTLVAITATTAATRTSASLTRP